MSGEGESRRVSGRSVESTSRSMSSGIDNAKSVCVGVGGTGDGSRVAEAAAFALLCRRVFIMTDDDEPALVDVRVVVN